MDQTDKLILDLLSQNSRMKIKDIAEQIHMTAPAVANRIQKLEEKEVITAYTADIDRTKTGCPIHVFITVTLQVSSHTNYLAYIKSQGFHLANHYRIAGAGCYLMELFFENNDQLSTFLDGLEKYASYQLSSVVNKID